MSFKPYESYKQSGADWLGSVPSHWSAARVKTLFEIRKRIAGELGHAVLSVTQKGLKVRDTESNDGQLSMDYSKYQLVEPDDFVMNHMDLLTGYVDVSKFHGVTSPDYRVFAARTKSLSLRFFLYLFQNGYQQRIFYAFGQGASGFGRWRMPTDSFNDFILPVPALSEQMAIVAFLDRETAKIDALVAEERRLIALLKEKRQAVILHAVTKGLDPSAPMKTSGIESLGKVPQHWGVRPLKYIATFESGGTPSKEKLDYWSGDIPWASAKDLKVDRLSSTIDNITRLALDEGAASLVPAKSVLVLVRGMMLARTFPVVIASIPMAINQDLKALNGLGVDNNYLAWALRGLEAETLSRIDEAGHGTKAIRMEAWTTMCIPLPPAQEQKAISTALEGRTAMIDGLIGEVETSMSLLHERRSALTSAAVTGKIDVGGLAEADAAIPDVVAA